MGCQMDSKQYTYRVTWSAEDNEYVGLCAEFQRWIRKFEQHL